MLLVKDVIGPAQVVAGSKATYRATAFNEQQPAEDELRRINWRIETAGSVVAELSAIGPVLDFEVPLPLVSQSIRVMPFRNSPSRVVSVLSEVVAAEQAIPSETTNRIVVLSRDEWKPKPNLPRLGTIVDRAVRTKVFIHHTDIVDPGPTPNEWDSIDEVKERMRHLQTIRAADLGADVPYSMVAFCMANGDLVLGEGRGLDRSGAHTKGHNTRGIGIAFQGNFELTPLPAQLDRHLISLGGWLRGLREQQGFVNLGGDHPAGREVFGHRDVKSTDCPGKHLFQRLPLIKFL